MTMKNTVTGICAAALMTIAIPAFAAGEAIGINAAVKGDVTVQSGEQAAKQAVIREEVFLGDSINSKKLSSLQVLLKDETTFTVGEDCELVIDKYVYNPNTNANSLTANVSKGMFRFMSGNISKSGPDAVSIDTPVASMGIRGTIVEGLVGAEAIEYARQFGIIDPNMVVDPNGATLFILRGPGRKSTAKNPKGEIKVTADGKTVTLRKSGMATFVPNKNSPPLAPFEIPSDIFEQFNVELRTQPSVDGPSYQPFPLDNFMEYDPPQAAPQPIEEEIVPYHPAESFDLPVGIDNVIGCTPNSPDYPSCLFGGGNGSFNGGP